MQREGGKCIFVKTVYCIFLLIKILFLDFKSKLGGTDVLEQNFFMYFKLPWDVTYSPTHTDPQDTTNQPKVIEVHDLPPAH